MESAKQRGHYKDGDLVFLWKSDPIPIDPIAVRGDLPDGFKQRVIAILQNIDLSQLAEADRKIMGVHGLRTVPQSDASFDGIRDLVKTLNIDLNAM
jgi:phosphonate transport system substrate-binding protein